MRLKELAKRYWMPIIIFIMGVMSIALLAWSSHLRAMQRQDFALMNAIMDLQIQVASSHLRFEEAIRGDPRTTGTRLWTGFDESIRLSGLILDGGESEHELVLKPLEASSLRTEAEALASLLTQLRSIALQRYQDPITGGMGSYLDLRYHDVYDELMTNAHCFEEFIETKVISDQFKVDRLLYGALLVWSMMVVAATVALGTREVRRLAAEERLQVANRQLELQTEELNKHRLHLGELVTKRTAELTTANHELRREIMEHERTATVLEESMSKFERLSLEFNALLDAIPDPILLLSPELEIQWSNRSASIMAHRGLAELTGHYCHEVRNGRTEPCDDCPVLQAFQTGKTGTRQYSAPDGSVWEIKAFPIWDGCANVANVIEVYSDITEKLALQRESMIMARLASMGELAAGVAHEINNPINGIVNYAQILVDESPASSEEHEILNRIIKEGNRIATIVKSLLSFARQDKAERVLVHVREILADALLLSQKQLDKDGIILKVDIPSELPQIVASPQQIEQVFLNILNNARYALNAKYARMDENKVLEIQCEELTVKDQPYVKVAFHDWGTGIPETLLTRIMEPFFSTKDSTHGTGLGLSISHGIVTDHGGKLSIKSVEHQYTRVEIVLPAHRRNGVPAIS